MSLLMNLDRLTPCFDHIKIIWFSTSKILFLYHGIYFVARLLCMKDFVHQKKEAYYE